MKTVNAKETGKARQERAAAVYALRGQLSRLTRDERRRIRGTVTEALRAGTEAIRAAASSVQLYRDILLVMAVLMKKEEKHVA